MFTAPSHRLFSDLMTGWVLTPGRHTLTRVLTLADPDGRRAHDAYHRFVRTGRWTTGPLWRVLAVHAVALTCPQGVVELLVDDTLAHKSGRQVAGAGVFRDAIRSTVKRIVYAWGLNLVVVCLRVSPPWGGTPIALPINLRVRTKTQGNKTTELAAEMIEEIAGWLPERSFHLTGDGAYACLLGAQLPRTHVTSRMRRDAALYEPAPPRTGKRGRPALKGNRLGKPPGLAAAAPSTAWTEVTVDMRGRDVQRLVAVFDVLWYAVRKDALVRLVVVRDPAGKEPDDFFVTTDLSASGADIASRYAGRWPIECCFKDAKQHAGVEHPQSWKDQGPARAVMLAFWLHTAVWCCYLASWNDKPPGGPAPGTPARPPQASSTPSLRSAGSCGTNELPRCHPAHGSPPKSSTRSSTRSPKPHSDSRELRNFTVELALIAADLLALAQSMLLTEEPDLHHAEPKTLRYRLLHTAARITRGQRKVFLRLAEHWPWALALERAFRRLRQIPLPA